MLFWLFQRYLLTCRWPLLPGYKMYFNKQLERWALHYHNKYVKGSIRRLDETGGHSGRASDQCGCFSFILMWIAKWIHHVEVQQEKICASLLKLWAQQEMTLRSFCSRIDLVLILFHCVTCETCMALSWCQFCKSVCQVPLKGCTANIWSIASRGDS